ncbi:MAG: hypothetical protein ACC628_27760 [Pirellulaceae bacterium]
MTRTFTLTPQFVADFQTTEKRLHEVEAELADAKKHTLSSDEAARLEQLEQDLSQKSEDLKLANASLLMAQQQADEHEKRRSEAEATIKQLTDEKEHRDSKSKAYREKIEEQKKKIEIFVNREAGLKESRGDEDLPADWQTLQAIHNNQRIELERLVMEEREWKKEKLHFEKRILRLEMQLESRS